MRTVLWWLGWSWASVRVAIAALLVLLLAAPAATARSVSDPDIGWPPALRRELKLPKVASRPCDREITRAAMAVQDRVFAGDFSVDGLLRRVFRHGTTNLWGSAWFAPCDGGRLHVGVASGGSARDTRAAVRKARRLLRSWKLTRDVRLVAVRSTYRQLMDQANALRKLRKRLSGQGDLESGIDTSVNAVTIEGDHEVPEADRALLEDFARRSPVSVVVAFEPAPDPNAPIPTYPVTFALDRASVDRAGTTVSVRITDPSCAATGPDDVASRFAGVRIRTLPHAFVLTARLRANSERGREECLDAPSNGASFATTVTLPEALGHRGLIDGTPGPSDFRFVALPPVGTKAIRSLVPKHIYTGRDCDARDVRQAFKGRTKTEWCFF